MAKAKFRAPRGCYDVLPERAPAWRAVEAAWRAECEQWGYGEIRTPILEEFDLFVRSSGEESEVVQKQMYDFMDKGDRHVAMKPEGTAPAVRAYLEHGIGQPGQVTRLWYFSPFFRYERPQAGRCRQLHQCGLELFGSSSPEADAEVIAITVAFYKRMGVDAQVRLNSIGRAETRRVFRQALFDYLADWLKDQSTDQREKAEANPLRLFDSKDPEVAALMEAAPLVTAHLEPESKAHFEAVQALLADAGVVAHLDPRIVRGLDYYTDTVFEVHGTGIGAQSALCGGGRYDGLFEELGGPATPAVGVGIGVERLMLVLEALEKEAGEAPAMDAFIIGTGDERALVRQVARTLREAGLSVQVDVEDRSFRAQFKQADKSGARHAVILGGDERDGGYATIRDMERGEETKVDLTLIAEAVRPA